MDKTEFLNYLNEKYTSNSSNSRLCRLVKVEKLLVKDPDEIVADDSQMFSALQQIDTGNVRADNDLKNALRTYYEFKNGKAFIKERDYIKSGK